MSDNKQLKKVRVQMYEGEPVFDAYILVNENGSLAENASGGCVIPHFELNEANRVANWINFSGNYPCSKLIYADFTDAFVELYDDGEFTDTIVDEVHINKCDGYGTYTLGYDWTWSVVD